MTQTETPGITLRDHLLQRLAHLPPPGTWPADEPLPTASDGELGRLSFTISAQSADELGRLGLPVPAVFTACLQALLFRVRPPWEGTADDDVVIAVGTSRHRPDDWLPIRQTIEASESFADMAARTCTELADAQSYQERSGSYRLTDLAADTGSTPGDICRAVLVLDENPGDGGTLDFLPDLILTLSPGDGYTGTLEYATSKYSCATAARILASYLEILGGAAHAPEVSVGSLPIVPTGDRVLPMHDDTSEWTVPAHELFERAAKSHPDLPALRWDGGELSYAELDAAAERFAAALGRPRTVALSGPRSAELIIALLATLKCGAGYVPLDPSYPKDRLDYMLADSRAEVLVCPADNASSFARPPDVRLVDLNAVWHNETQETQAQPDRATTGDELCYVIYTSGSTGRPKGVEMPHRPLASLLAWQAQRSAATTGWNTLQFAAFSFDVAFQELFATWQSGGTLVLLDDETRRDPSTLLDHIIDHRIHRLYAPFVALQQLAETAVSRGRYPGELREVITAGEQLHVSPAIRQFFQRTGASLDNQYGPTETHVVTAERLAPDPADWPELPPIGAPIDRAAVEILDERQQLLPVGVPGEICVSGVPLAHGYVGSPELTSSRFVQHADDRPRTYRTGDFGRMLPGGRIQYLGRQDDQVKIRGIRVELGEIEARLKAEVGLADAVVVVRDSPVQGKQLVAYYLLTAGFDVPPAALRRSLRTALPDHMVPAVFVAVAQLPLTPSGKVDRRALANSALPADPDAAYSAVVAQTGPGEPEPTDKTEASTPIERVVAEVWAEALCRASIAVHTNLFAIGGNSRTALEVSALLSDIFRVAIPVRLLFDRPTIAGQAARLTEMERSCPHSLTEIAQRLLTYDVEVVVDH